MKNALIQVVTLLIGFGVGFFTNDYVAFRSLQRDLLRSEFNDVRETARKIDNQLALLSLVARGEEEPEPKVVSQLSENILELRNEADAVTKRVPQAEPQFEDYAESMVLLRNAAQQLSGPNNGKEFVEAVSQFLFSRDRFESVVTEYQGRYLLF